MALRPATRARVAKRMFDYLRSFEMFRPGSIEVLRRDFESRACGFGSAR